MAPSRAMRPLQTICARCAARSLLQRYYTTTPRLQATPESHLPRIARPSFWTSLIPKPLRRSTDASEETQLKPPRSKEWNPFTIFIILGVLVGSNAINLLALRNEMLSFSRKTEAKLELLREVVQRVKDGEDVDVKKVLGAGDALQEAEWEEVVRELEETDPLAAGREKREARKVRREEAKRLKEEERAKAAEREGSPTAEPRGDGQEVRDGRPKFLM